MHLTQRKRRLDTKCTQITKPIDRKMPDELQKQLPHLWELLDAMNIPVLKKPGFEADDIIGTITESVSKEKIESYIVSGDKDFYAIDK